MRTPAAEPSRRSAGFTLVEAIVAMVIMSIAVLGVTYAVGFGARAQAVGGTQTRTVELAQAYFEEIAARQCSRSVSADTRRHTSLCESHATQLSH